MIKVKCHNCGYEWETKSQLGTVNCSSCRRPTKRIKEEKQEEEEFLECKL